MNKVIHPYWWLALVGVCVPFFWLGLLLILLFSVALHWLPAGGFVPFSENPRANLASMLLFGTGLVTVAMGLRKRRKT